MLDIQCKTSPSPDWSDLGFGPLLALPKVKARWRMRTAKGIPKKIHASINFGKLTLVCMTVVASVALHAEQRNYNLCPNIHSVYLSDPGKSRAMVINYDRSTKSFIFLRCGESDVARPQVRTEQLSCHVYQTGTAQELCNKEAASLHAGRVVADVFDAGASAAISGGLSTFSQVSRGIGVARDLSKPRKCPGLNLMLAMSVGQSSAALQNAFFESQLEQEPNAISLVNRLALHNPAKRGGYIFNGLDRLLSPRSRSNGNEDKKVTLEGPAYLIAERNNSGVDRLLVDSPGRSEFCSLFNPPQPPAATETVEAAH